MRDVTKSFDAKQVYESYVRTKSVHRTAKEFGTTGDTICNFLKRNGYVLNRRAWTSEDDAKLIELYNDETIVCSDMGLILGRTADAVQLRANELGITGKRLSLPVQESSKKKMSDTQKKMFPPERRKEISKRQKAWISKNGHPKGMKGKKHSDETKKVIGEKGIGRKPAPGAIAKAMKTKLRKYGRIGNDISRMNCTWKSGWRQIGGERVYFRSRWEFNYAVYLQWMLERGEITKWEHEPKTFWFEKIRRGCRSYLPDFRVTYPSGSVEYHEVKGWMDARSKTKLKRMAKYHPDVVLVVIRESWFKVAEKGFACLLPLWEWKEPKRQVKVKNKSEEKTEIVIEVVE